VRNEPDALAIHLPDLSNRNQPIERIGFPLGNIVYFPRARQGNLRPNRRGDTQELVGAGGAIDTDTVIRPILAFVLDPQGLTYNLSLEGSKISRIRR
jgi:hypothetical protein